MSWSALRDQFLIMRLVGLLTIGFMLLPFIVVLGASFDSGDFFHVVFPPRDASLKWYWEIPPDYFHAARNSVLVAVAAALISTVIGGFAAFGIIRGNLVAKDAFLSFFRLPVQVPLVVTGAVFLQFYYQMSATLGLNLIGSLWGVIIAHVFVSIPYAVGSISSVLARFDTSLEEAAHSLGAGHLSTFWNVTLPSIRAGVIGGMLYSFIVSFGDVPVAFFLTKDRSHTLPVRLFIDMQVDFRPSMLAISTIIVLVSISVIVLMQRAGVLNIAPSSKK